MQTLINKAFVIWSKAITGSRQRWRWIGYAFTLLAFIYLAALILLSREQIQQFPWKVYRGPLLLAVLIYPIALLIQYIVWSRLISFHHHTNWRDLATYLRVLLIRRLPGGIWHWVDRTAIYTGTTQIPAHVVMLANFLEWSLLLIIATAIGVAGWQDGVTWLRWILLIALLALAIYLAYSWQPRQRPILSRMLESGLWLGMYFIVWMVGGLILYSYSTAAQGSLTDTASFPLVTYVQCAWSWAVAGGISQLMVFLPGGIGIREIALTQTLRDALPVSSILLMSILIRLTYALADLLWGSLGLALSLPLFRHTTGEKPVVEQ